MKQLRIAIIVLLAAMPVVRLAAQTGSSDAELVKWKIVAMGVFFRGVWKDFFSKQPHIYVAPTITWYTGKTNSACGELGLNNAFYCNRDNTVYCELGFLVEQKRLAAAALKSSGE